MAKKAALRANLVHAVISRNAAGTAVVKPGHAQLRVGDSIEWENKLTSGVKISILWVAGHFHSTATTRNVGPGNTGGRLRSKKKTGVAKTYQIYVPATGELVIGSDPDIDIK